MTEPAKVADGEALPLRLKWLATWPDKEADFSALAVGYHDSVGRIYLYDSSPSKTWFWAMNAHGPEVSRNVGALHGIAGSARAAARLVEDAWFAAIKGSALDRPEPKRNAYELAKAGE